MPVNVEEDKNSRRSGLEAELRETISSCEKLAARSYVFAQLVFCSSVLGSFFATVFVSGELGAQYFDNHEKLITAILAALPATMILLNNSFRFEERTSWFWRKVRISQRYLRLIRDSKNPDLESISTEYSKKMEELESEWPAMAGSSAQPKK